VFKCTKFYVSALVGVLIKLHYVPSAMPVFPNVFASKIFLTAKNNHGSSHRCSR